MGTLGDGLSAFNWVTKRIDQVSNWIKSKKRREDVQKMDNALSNDNDAIINDKLSKLKQKVKDRLFAR